MLFRSGTRVILGIRPEHWAVGENQLALRVDLVEPLGSETLVHGHLAGQEDAAIVVKVAGKAPAGEAVPIAVDPTFLHVFSAEAGQRLDAV